MQATVWKNTTSQTEGGIYGIRVGIRNHREHFPDESWEWVDVEIDGTVHRFRLLRGFWRKCPEIRDDDRGTLRTWIMRNCSLTWRPRNPPHVRLLPLGGRRFRLVEED
jgi:hypothetical protein